MRQEIKYYTLDNVMEQEIEVVENARILGFYHRLDELRMDCLVDSEQVNNDTTDKYSILTIATGGVPCKVDYCHYKHGGILNEGLASFHIFYRKI